MAVYARVKLLEEYGGIYMYTDVEVVKCFDDLLHYEAFMCFERPKNVSIGTFGAEAHSNLLRDLLHIYDQLSFYKDGPVVTNLQILTRLFQEDYHLVCNGRMLVLPENIAIFPMEAFIAKDYLTG